MNPIDVFEAVRRGYNELETASPSEINDYFNNVDEDALMGHISNIKGIVFEQQIEAALTEQGLDAQMFEATNHPISDIAILENGNLIGEVQLKATDSADYISLTLADNPDVPIIATTEVAQHFDNSMVIDSGIANSQLTQDVENVVLGGEIETVSDSVVNESLSETVSDAIGESISPVPISPIGVILALLGLGFFFFLIC